MMQTKLDRWLIETFVYEYNILVIQPPQKKGWGMKVSEIPYSPSTPFKYKIWVKSKKKADTIIEDYRKEGLTFKTNIVEGKHWYNWLINNKRKSFTFRVFWWTFTLIMICIGIVAFHELSQTEFYEKLLEDFDNLMNSSD
ncbi:hypothetical protein SAMN02745181_3627 [Rubritalea squalenifaciens DSM 18772]|uniref:Uncharacterized protein n=1 Tax=Rubritalea squalenifaciens DSM 18772 TaxID=1123071 RepID=A0A1M6RKQ1_9BACT|nr:hypothetical protein [Rubritalea squalenifaciens]SHK33009.1 hypothetical protein SAMN02745181_3627 [Rubritalea squalenifaciens DSM 18772]